MQNINIGTNNNIFAVSIRIKKHRN